MRPAGLRSLQLGPPSAEDESRTIIAEASPAMPLAKLIPKGTVPQGRSVRVVARITLSAAASVPGRRLAATSPAARTLEGGVVLPQTAATELVVVGWNTSNIATWSNDSHGEHQLVSYLERERVGGQRLMTMIESIEVNVINYSPCAMCTDELASVLEQIADARGRTFVGTSGAILAWRDYYPGFRGGQAAKTWQGIGRPSRAGWTLRAPASGRPQATDGVQSAGFYENAHLVRPL